MSTMGLRDKAISAGFAVFGATRLHRLAAGLTGGLGAILMLHHVRPWVERDFAPNRLLEITPDFLIPRSDCSRRAASM